MSDKPRRTLRALLVEDSVDDAELVELQLQRDGYRVAAQRVDNRASLEAALSGQEWDIILSDHAMPSFSALDVLEILERRSTHTPCIVVSGAIGEEAAVQLLKNGAVDYVNKSRLYMLGPAVERALREAAEVRGRRAAEEALRESEARFRLIAENARDLISMTNMAGRYVYVSPSFETVLGYSPQELLESGPVDLIHPEDRELFRQWQAMEHFELRMRDIAGDWRWVEGSTSLVMWHGEPHLINISRDISSQKEMTERLKQLAFFDPLSGLPNRTLLQDRLRQALAQAQRLGRHVGVIFLDFDNFKVLNDSLGHEFGDRVLRVVAEKINSSVREEDTVARLGGDEFVVVLPLLTSHDDAAIVARKIKAAIEVPFTIDDQSVAISASLGIAVSEGGHPPMEDLLKHADLAMYLAKSNGPGEIRFFTPSLNLEAVERLNLERDLRQALERDELVLHYQPQFDLSTMKVTGMEALVRWLHPTRGLIYPGTFIPVAEETGLITEIGRRVLFAASKQMARWLADGLPLERIAVNLSPRQFNSDLPRIVREALEQASLEPWQLELEVTESAAIAPGFEHGQLLHELHQAGVCIAIDDFGTGYSNLSHLKQLPIHSLKVDRNFVQNLTSPDYGSEDAAILRAVVDLGRSLNLRVIGEGIESHEQLSFLSGTGFHEGQGFLLGRPVPAHEASYLLSHRNAAGPW